MWIEFIFLLFFFAEKGIVDGGICSLQYNHASRSSRILHGICWIIFHSIAAMAEFLVRFACMDYFTHSSSIHRFEILSLILSI